MAGIPTVLITVVPEKSRQMGPPRAFAPTGCKRGKSLGVPHQIELQRKVLRDALRRWEAREEAGTIWEWGYAGYVAHDDSRQQELEEE